MTEVFREKQKLFPYTSERASEKSNVPEVGGEGSAGCSTDSCLKTAYLSEAAADEEPVTGVSMAGTLLGHNGYSQKSGGGRFKKQSLILLSRLS